MIKTATSLNIKSRYFNQVIDCGDFYQKSSLNWLKLNEEYHFLTTIPSSLSSYYPRTFEFKLDGVLGSYNIAKIPTHDASHFLITSARDNKDTILYILEHLKTYLSLIPVLNIDPPAFEKAMDKDVYLKNIDRVAKMKGLAEYAEFNKICQDFGYQDLDDYCHRINEDLRERILQCDMTKLYYSHGDLCFSNILYYESQVFLIDPKGYLGDSINTYRPLCYDLAKLSQSILGHYDLINNEMFDIVDDKIQFYKEPEESSEIEKSFLEILSKFCVDKRMVRVLEASLFLSLIPFHKESNKKMLGYLLNSISIFHSA